MTPNKSHQPSCCDLELKPPGHLNDPVESAEVESVGDLAKGRTIDVEDPVAHPDIGVKNANREVSVVEQVERVGPDLEPYALADSDVLGY